MTTEIANKGWKRHISVTRQVEFLTQQVYVRILGHARKVGRNKGQMYELGHRNYTPADVDGRSVYEVPDGIRLNSCRDL